ncbi:hypothetical protein IM774_01325 [Erysipelotrichaceae bacterium RD49]|nr:hypothetical protein [Erysipelotrichaceae bacterium RD49]
MEKFQTDVFNSTDSDLKSSLAHPLNVQECESVAMVETAKDRHGNDVSKKHFEIYFQAVQDITLQIYDFLKHGFEYGQPDLILTYFLIFDSNDEPDSFFDRCQKLHQKTDESYQRIGDPKNLLSTLYLVYFANSQEKRMKSIFEAPQYLVSDADPTSS